MRGLTLAVASLAAVAIAAGPKKPTLSSHLMTQIDRLHARGITGKGVKVAIIGNFVNSSHEAFAGGHVGPCGAADLSGSSSHEEAPADALVDSTEYAGVIAAQPRGGSVGFTGVAPGVHLCAYRLPSPPPGHRDAPVDALVPALDRAVADGNRIILLTYIGSGVSSRGAIARAVDRAAARGAVVVAQASDAGGEGLFSQAAPAIANGAVSVGSAQNPGATELDGAYTASYSVGGAQEAAFDFLAAKSGETGEVIGLPATPVKPQELFATSRDVRVTDDDACEPLPDGTPDLHDKVVLVRLGSCEMGRQLQHAAAKGAKTVLLYPRRESDDPIVYYVGDESPVAFGMIRTDVARDMIASLKAGRRVRVKLPTANSETHDILFSPPSHAPPGVSRDSAWGPNWDLALQPQVLGVGESVLTTSLTSYVPASGTGIASAMVAGVFALMAQARSSLDADAMKSLLVTTAKPLRFVDGAGQRRHLAPVAQQGGGLVCADDAARCAADIRPPSLSFNDTEHAVRTLRLVIKNRGERKVLYHVSHLPALTAYTLNQDGTFAQFPEQLETAAAFADVALSHKSIALAPGQSVAVTVTPSAPKGLDAGRLPLWSGYVAFNGSDGCSHTVPYQGMTGSIRKHRVLDPNAATAEYDGETVQAGTVVPLPPRGSNETSNFTLSVASRSGLFEVDARLVPATSSPGGRQQPGRQLHGFPVAWDPALEPDLPVVSAPMTVRWDGRLASGEYAAEGEYKIAARALRIFGDPKKDEDCDTSVTQSFRIKYRTGPRVLLAAPEV